MADCIHHPEQPYRPGRPARIEERAVFGWDAGANSVREESGDARLAFTMGHVFGAVIGIAARTLAVGDYARISHGFSFSQNAAGHRQAQVIESGQLKGSPFSYFDATRFELWRVASTVLYLVDDTRLFVSRKPSTGTLVAACSLFATGDSVP